MKIKKVLFLTVDALPFHRLVLEGRKSEKHDVVSYLESNGLFCKNAFAHGLPTQLSFPSIFTSTFPLDSGGYDFGIRSRHTSFVEVLKENGFKTVGLATGNSLGKYSGYCRGFDEFYELFDIKQFWEGIKKVYSSYYQRLLTSNEMSQSDFNKELGYILDQTLLGIRQYSEDKIKTSGESWLAHSRVLHKYDYKRLLELIAGEPDYQKMGDLPIGKIHDRLKNIFLSSRSFANNVNRLNKFESFLNRLPEVFRNEAIGAFWKLKEPYVSGHYLANLVMNQVEKNRSEKLFLWAHFLDIHEYNFTSGRFQFPVMLGPNGMTTEVLKARFRRELAVERAVRYVFDQIGEIVTFLKRNNLLDETLIAICSDHGIANYHPIRKAHKASLFYEEFVKTPLLFSHPSFKGEVVENLCGLIDFAPTLLDILNIPFEGMYGFRGHPIYSTDVKKREFVVMENLGRGPCDFERKPMNVCIRTERYKYLWRENNHREKANWVDQESWRGISDEFYDLRKDPQELTNLVGSPFYEKTIKSLEANALDRCCEVRSQGNKESNG